MMGCLMGEEQIAGDLLGMTHLILTAAVNTAHEACAGYDGELLPTISPA